MEIGIRYTHVVSVIIFLLIYLLKTVLLLFNKNEALANFNKGTKVFEMIISTLFLVTGIYMLTQIPEIKSLLIAKIVVVIVLIPIAIIGFKKKNKILAFLSLLLIVCAYGMAEMSKKQKSKALQGISASNVNGFELYDAACLSCHGADGKLGTMGARNLATSKMNLEARIEIITNGKASMNPFKGVLTNEQIKAVAEYSESIKK